MNMADASEDEDTVDLPFIPPVDPKPDDPWPERVARPVFHGGWGVRPAPPTEPPAKDQGVV